MHSWCKGPAWGAFVLCLSLPAMGLAQVGGQSAKPAPPETAALGRLRQAALSLSARPSYEEHLLGPKPSPELLRIQEYLVGQGAAIVPSLLPLLREKDLRVSEAAADVLERIPGKAAHPALIIYSLDHLLDEPRRTKKISGPGYPRLVRLGLVALPSIAKAYNQEASKKSPRLLYQATLVRAAAAMPDRAGLSLVRNALWRSCPSVAATAAYALGELGGPTALSELVRFLEPHRFLCRQMEGPDRRDPCAAGVNALALLGNRDAVEPLLKLLIRLGPERDDPEWVSYHPDWISCQSEAHRAIEHLTGQKMNRDIECIRAWVDAYNRSHRQPNQ